jgi:YVTN family beta-propeller protein
MGICVSPDGSKVYVTNNLNNTDSLCNSVSVINTATNTVTATIPVGISPIGICANPDGSKVYVANGGNSMGNTVSVINSTADTVSATITVGTQPYGISVSPDGSKVYVVNSCSSGNVSVINTVTDTVIATIAVGSYPNAFGNFISIYPFTGIASQSMANAIILNQNDPNPFAEETDITYFLPETVGTATIMFYDNTGVVIKAVQLQSKGNGTLHVFASNLSSGLYTYALIADGKLIDSKKMMKSK